MDNLLLIYNYWCKESKLKKIEFFVPIQILSLPTLFLQIVFVKYKSNDLGTFIIKMISIKHLPPLSVIPVMI